MKKLLMLAFLINTTLLEGCTKEDRTETIETEMGVVKGRVSDSKGNGMPNVKVVIENTVYYASYVHAFTDANGYYKTKVPQGSWHASAMIERNFLDKTYRFDLSPDSDDSFAGTEGAVRNFTWKLTGAKPYGGFYGSDVAVYGQPGVIYDAADVELTLTPDGPLIDGSTGTSITKKLIDIGGGEDGIRDVAIGKYTITARNTTTNKPMQIRLRNTGVYGSSVTTLFKSGFTGLTNYQIVVQVQ